MKNKPEDISPEIRKLYENLYARPGMYIGYPGVAGGENLTLLSTFINGMSYCSFIKNNNAENYIFIPDGFNEYVADYYKVNQNAHNYYSMIVLKESGETEAFEKFWELLNKYLVLLDYKPLKCEKIQNNHYKHDNGIQKVFWTDMDELSSSYIRTFSDWNKKTAFDRLKNMYLTPGFSGNALWKSDKCIGAIIGKYEEYPDGTYFQISDFWVEPEYQYKGYAKELLIDKIEQLKYCGCKRIYVVTLNNDNAEGFFRHFKFELHKGLYTLLI